MTYTFNKEKTQVLINFIKHRTTSPSGALPTNIKDKYTPCTASFM